MLKPQIPVAKEGYPFIGFAAFCTVVMALLNVPAVTITLLFVTTFVLCFFRDPERFVPTREDAVVSPADGKVILVEKIVDNQFATGEVHKISIFMNVFNVHVNRIPYNGKVDKVLYKTGKFYSADSERGGLENEQCATIIRTPQEKTVVFVQIAGLIARRIICWLEPGDEVAKGKRYGLIRFGSRVDLYLPIDTDILVKPGEKVRAGETIVGYIG